jgi:GNAT superfamily N-acetyltransferase
MTLSFALAAEADAEAIARVRSAAADRLTREHGKGHWSTGTTARGVLLGMRDSRVLVGREGDEVVATLRLATRKPWAIDIAYFTPVKGPLYLLDMAVLPERQRRGLGRRLLDHAAAVAHGWPADALRLDAYDAPAGAGPFYARCGFRETGRATYRGVPLLYYERLLS